MLEEDRQFNSFSNGINYSIIIPHYNNVTKLSLCLQVLNTLYGQRPDIEVIVVDNGSTISLEELKSTFPVIWLEEKTIKSPYACRNQGIKQSKGNIIILLDSNCIPLKGWLEEGIKKLDASNIICGGQLEFIHSNDIFSRFDLLYGVIYPEDMNNRRSLPAGNLFIYRDTFAKIGLFYPEIRSLGDIEWTNRAYRAGYQLRLTDQSVVTYQTKTRKAFITKMIRLGEGTKHQYVYAGGRLLSLNWVWKVIKSILPPNPIFVKRMNNQNKRENTKLSVIYLVILCWLTKILRGYGMLTGKSIVLEDIKYL